ncbi:MAG: hypothetical protein A2X61_11015 [Ignavibacteria bacterium GWB2_35_12]|nr:MAG: hypothetical protein A2X61_11015 [Ignavibacteria bacterium GWB2_35_12]OGV24768.1 MAG: hypothetical protein A2475_14240 [Ignavibacteria bacterium RIFOXYC2_FULL_35_21]
MNKNDINTIVEDFSTLDIESQEYLVDIFQKQVNQSKREKLINAVREAEVNYNAGNVKHGSVQDLMKDLSQFKITA